MPGSLEYPCERAEVPLKMQINSLYLFQTKKVILERRFLFLYHFLYLNN